MGAVHSAAPASHHTHAADTEAAGTGCLGLRSGGGRPAKYAADSAGSERGQAARAGKPPPAFSSAPPRKHAPAHSSSTTTVGPADGESAPGHARRHSLHADSQLAGSVEATPLSSHSRPDLSSPSPLGLNPMSMFESECAVWNEWTMHESWVAPAWFTRDAVISEEDEALVLRSIETLKVSRPFRHAQEVDAKMREQERKDRGLLPGQQMPKDSAADAVELLVRPPLDPITFFAMHFYEGLFVTIPALRRLFKSPLAVQGRQMVGSLVEVLVEVAPTTRGHVSDEERDRLLAGIKQRTIEHYNFGVQINQYNMVGEALFHSFRVCIGEDAFTPEMLTAWGRLYSFILQHTVRFHDEIVEQRKAEQKLKAEQDNKTAAAQPPAEEAVKEQQSQAIPA